MLTEEVLFLAPLKSGRLDVYIYLGPPSGTTRAKGLGIIGRPQLTRIRSLNISEPQFLPSYSRDNQSHFSRIYSEVLL